jgi:predicted RNase H-like nuclease (RuvC/YqgF family)
LNRTKSSIIEQKNAENDKKFTCKFCKKSYKARNSLWYHENKCEFIADKSINKTDENIHVNQEQLQQSQTDIQALTGLIFELVKSNTELQKSMFEICKQGQNNYTSNVSNNNCNNKTFNLQFFLNETCKDAMNISDFVESVKLQVSDLEHVGKVGYIEGISNIIIKNLNALEVEKRPVHCTDQKREVMYVKEDNIWEKEDEANKKLRKAIRMIAHKNICMFKEFRDKYPDYDDYDSKRNSQYNTIVYEAMGGKGDNDYEKDTKIIKKIAKNVTIDKN